MRAQITARFGDSLVETVEIERDGSYRIGTAPDVDLAVAKIGSFPIVTGDATGFLVRRPVGMGEDVRLTADQPVTLRFGMITITVELVAPAAPLPVQKIDRRPYAFIVGSLIVHLLVWGAAVIFAHVPKVNKPRPRIVERPLLVKLLPMSPPRVAPHAPATASASPSHTPSSGGGLHGKRSNLDELAAAAASTPGDGNGLSAAYRAYLEADDQHMKDMLDAADPLYVEDDASGFGKHGGAFDPTNRAGWGTIATGRYKTVSSGRAVGDDYHLAGESYPELALCESPHCEIAGSLDKDAVQHVIAPQVAALANCVGQDSLTLALEIAPNGHVKKVHGHGKIGRCAANVIGQLAFPEADGTTTATYTIGYP